MLWYVLDYDKEPNCATGTFTYAASEDGRVILEHNLHTIDSPRARSKDAPITTCRMLQSSRHFQMFGVSILPTSIVSHTCLGEMLCYFNLSAGIIRVSICCQVILNTLN